MIAAEVSTGNAAADVAIAVVGGCVAVMIAWLPLRNARNLSRVSSGVEAVKTEVSTNHGKRAGEYLELIHDDVRGLRADFVDFKIDHEVRLRTLENLVQSKSPHSAAPDAPA